MNWINLAIKQSIDGGLHRSINQSSIPSIKQIVLSLDTTVAVLACIETRKATGPDHRLMIWPVSWNRAGVWSRWRCAVYRMCGSIISTSRVSSASIPFIFATAIFYRTHCTEMTRLGQRCCWSRRSSSWRFRAWPSDRKILSRWRH